MSDYFIRFVPDNPFYKLDTKKTDAIKNLDWYKNNVSISVSEIIRFADAGENFESVLCPFCGADLMNWWGEAMDMAYSGENGFEDISVITPCCNRAATLQNLAYNFQQGFYKTIVEIEPEPLYDINDTVICEQLRRITDTTWRVIHTRY